MTTDVRPGRTMCYAAAAQSHLRVAVTAVPARDLSIRKWSSSEKLSSIAFFELYCLFYFFELTSSKLPRTLLSYRRSTCDVV